MRKHLNTRTVLIVGKLDAYSSRLFIAPNPCHRKYCKPLTLRMNMEEIPKEMGGKRRPKKLLPDYPQQPHILDPT